MKIRTMILASVLPVAFSGALNGQDAAGQALDQRAQAFGFAARLPQSTEMALGVRNLKSVLDGVGGKQFLEAFHQAS